MTNKKDLIAYLINWATEKSENIEGQDGTKHVVVDLQELINKLKTIK